MFHPKIWTQGKQMVFDAIQAFTVRNVDLMNVCQLTHLALERAFPSVWHHVALEVAGLHAHLLTNLTHPLLAVLHHHPIDQERQPPVQRLPGQLQAVLLLELPPLPLQVLDDRLVHQFPRLQLPLPDVWVSGSHTLVLDAVNGKLVVQQCPLGIKCFVAHLQCSIYNIVIIQVDFSLISLLLEDISYFGGKGYTEFYFSICT